MTLKSDAKFEEKLTCCLENDRRNFANFHQSTRKCQNWNFNKILLSKYILFELQKYRGVIFHDTEELCKFWRKTDQWFEKRHEKFGKFSPEHLKVSKLGLWWDPFVQSRKCLSLKFTKVLCVNAMKNYAKFEEELTCHFKINRNFRTLTSTLWKSKKYAL